MIFRDPDNRFVLLPTVNDVMERTNGYIAIVADPSLRCLRDLRGEHVRLLSDIKCMSLQHLPAGFDQCSIHYHPRVYQLHVHFRIARSPHQTDARVFMLDTVIKNLRDDPLYYKTTVLTYSVASSSDIVRVMGAKCRLEFRHPRGRVSMCCRVSPRRPCPPQQSSHSRM